MFRRTIFNFEFKVIALILVIFSIVVVTGLLAFFRFSDLLENISQSVRSDNRLVLFHSLRNDLTELTNIAKTNSLKEDNSYRERYIQVKEELSQKLETLKKQDDSAGGIPDLSVLDTLIRDKLIVIDGIMYGEDPFRVQKALGKVIVNLETSETEENTRSAFSLEELDKPILNEPKSTNITSIREELDLELIRNSKKQLDELEKEEGKLLKKLKRAEKRNKTERISELDSLLQLKKGKAIDIHKKLTKEEEIAQEYERDKLLTINQIYKGIENVSSEELVIEKEIKSAQLKLISMDNFLSMSISSVFDKFELIENARISEATKYAEQENKKTRIYFTVFSVFVALLLVLMAYIIIQYVKKNNLYKQALKRSNNEAEQLAKTRERLMATISHEIRTPMHAISGFSEQLSKEELTEKQQEYLSMIRKSSEHLTYLVNDVLDFSKLQNSKLKLDKIPFDLHELVDDVVLFSKQLVQDNRLAVNLEMDNAISGFYLGDPYRLRQILLNIMGNAIKFTDEGSVALSLKLLKSENKTDSIRITIQDTGIGINKKDLEKVFVEFEQAGKGEKSQIRGTGLGLPIVKRLVELHKGKITLDSEQGKGTKVEIFLDLEQAKRKELTRNSTPLNTIDCDSILVVDDEEYNRKLLKSVFSDFDVRLLEAENGKVAMEYLANESVDLVLLDARMPVMDGEETIKAIRLLEDDRKRNVRIILLTAAGNELDGLLEQVDGFVSKPFTQDVLINEINRVCSGSPAAHQTTLEKNGELSGVAVDFSNLRTLSGSDKAFYADMLSTFISTTTNSYQNIKAAFVNKDLVLVANEAHKIASPCRHIGAVRLHTLLKEIEQNSRKEKNIRKINKLIKELDEEVSVVLELVNQEITSIH